ncbi:hypothetical protein BY458DRAFT_535551 [Sporodiniella umbellata]|nr:hypothetical protein BY458DRAFT_535551 [Sporodiniella umbellata]
MKKANEMKIDLEDKEYYFPGEILRGRVELNISKPTTTEYITLTFRGWIEWQGEKVELIGESKKLALPISAGQKHTVFKPENKNAFDFEFKIPENINLPSSVKISKVVDIRYTLTAVDKKPLYKKLQTLPTVERTITVLDLIDVELPQFCNEICLSGDLGFLNDIKLTQWNMRSPRSAFLPGNALIQ